MATGERSGAVVANTFVDRHFEGLPELKDLLDRRQYSLDVAAPTQVGEVLRYAAERLRESEWDIDATWQDEGVGRVWRELAKVLERAAIQADRVTDKWWK